MTFVLPDHPSRATLRAKLREQEWEQEDEDNLVEFLKNQGEDTPQNQVDEPVAVLAMVHHERHAKVISNVMQYAALRRADKVRKGKMLGALGVRNKKGRTHRLFD